MDSDIMNDLIKEMREYASINKVPIIQDDSLKYICDYIKDNNIRRVLEVGSAIGYSAIMMCIYNPSLVVTTIERDEKRYLEAVHNIKKFSLEERIHLIFHDALDVNINGMYDLLFIDAAKAQNEKFFSKFETNIINHGTIITDNMNFHGLVDVDLDSIESRNVRGLVRKIKSYKSFLENNDKYDTKFLNIGDGLAVSKKK